MFDFVVDFYGIDPSGFSTCAYLCDVVRTFQSSSRFGWTTHRPQAIGDRHSPRIESYSAAAHDYSRSPLMCGNTAGIGGK